MIQRNSGVGSQSDPTVSHPGSMEFKVTLASVTASVQWDRGILLTLSHGMVTKGDRDGRVERRCGSKIGWN